MKKAITVLLATLALLFTFGCSKESQDEKESIRLLKEFKTVQFDVLHDKIPTYSEQDERVRGYVVEDLMKKISANRYIYLSMAIADHQKADVTSEVIDVKVKKEAKNAFHIDYSVKVTIKMEDGTTKETILPWGEAYIEKREGKLTIVRDRFDMSKDFLDLTV
ncbi:hypothetical protein [Gorillibacterium massiliense]|uniref:hypothetical protein n=1 Tax=Gorillibacterium massiliense TaxID=1280390 RepID=UPI0004B85794|nr:hypothetical protein [Gorillibacterium massiliense]